VLELGREDLRRFHWSSHLTRTSEFLKKVGKKDESDNPSLRCIKGLLGTG